MRRFIPTLLVLICFTTSFAFPQQRGKQSSRASRTLTVALAQRILTQQINEATVNNTIFTCRACYSFDDKEENDNFVVVSTYPGMNQFLRSQGYIRLNRERREVFTARAKRSKYFEAHGDGYGGFGGAGLRFANFRNPRVTSNRITDPKNVPIEYDLVPTELTVKFFGKVQRIKSRASFTYEGRKWSVCIDCRN